MEKADLVLSNAKIWTVDKLQPWAEAIAIRNKEILAVGSNQEIGALVGSRTRVFDLNKELVLPGFNDVHTHYLATSLFTAGSFDLYGVNTLRDVQNVVRQYSKEHPDFEWLVGWRWNNSMLGNDQWPSRIDLDNVESQRPVTIIDIDGHSCWVNTYTLQKTGYDRNTPDPEGGKIIRDSQGHPTGILFEKAYMNVIPKSEKVDPARVSAIIKTGVDRLSRLGITSISDVGIQSNHLKEYIGICEKMAEQGELNVRINEWPYLGDGLEMGSEYRQRFSKNDYIHVVGLKLLIDGVLANRTAWMLEDYADAPGNKGFPVFGDLTEVSEWVLRADAAGFQVIIHAIGDRAVREVLDIYERARRTNGERDSRHRIEHVEVAHPTDQRRFVELNVIPSMTPIHLTADVDEYIKNRLGEERSYAYAWRSFLDLGAHLCFGTDFPAIDLLEPDPLKQIYAAVTRTQPGVLNARVWHPEQRISVAEAIRCYTQEGAYAEFMEHRKGSIIPGKLADLYVLSENILEAPPERILDTQVVMTIFDGKVVYQNQSIRD